MSSALLELLRSHDIEQAHNGLTTRGQLLGSQRFTGIADGSLIADLYIGTPTDSTTDYLVVTTIGAGGLAHVDTTDDAAVDTAGTDLPLQANGDIDPAAASLNVEYGGSYSAGGTTLNSVSPGTDRTGGPATTTGRSDVAALRLLQPGESVLVSVTNESGATVDADVELTAVPIER